MEDEVELAHVLEAPVERLDEDLRVASGKRQLERKAEEEEEVRKGVRRTWMRSRIPSSDSLWSTTNAK